MPSCRITNHTNQTLNISLKQVTALHFENEVLPGATIKFKPGKVWFTLEALTDEGPKSDSRYSVLKSAATIALISLAVAAVAATAGAALIPEAAAGTAAVLLTATKSALVRNAGTITKVSGVVLPKAIDRIAAEVGGLSALQREVLSIISSPTLSTDVRKKATSILHSLHSAYRKDAATSSSTASATPSEPTLQVEPSKPVTAADKEEEQAALEELEAYELVTPELETKTVTLIDKEPIASPSTPSKFSLKLPSFRRRKGAVEGNVRDGEVKPVQTKTVLRVHGIFMNDRRAFSIRMRTTPDGLEQRMELFDTMKAEVVS